MAIDRWSSKYFVVDRRFYKFEHPLFIRTLFSFLLLFLEPKYYVSIKRPGKVEEEEPIDEDELPPPYHPFIPDGYDHDIPFEHKNMYISHKVIVMTLSIVCVVLFCAAVTILGFMISRRKKKYMFATGRSVMTFSNPNYYTSNNEVQQPPPTTDKKPFLWKRLKYDKSQVSYDLLNMSIFV